MNIEHRRIACWSLVLVTALFGGTAAAQITVPAGSTMNLGSGALNAGCLDLNIAGNFMIGSGSANSVRNIGVAAGGTLDGGSGLIGISGNFSELGSFGSGTGAVQVGDGCAVTTSTFGGASSFYNFVATTLTGHTLIFPANLTQSVAHSLTLTGVPGNLLKIRSSSAGNAANLALANGAAQTVAYVDVADNHATVERIAPGAPALSHSVDSGNTDGWFTNAITSFGLVPIPTLQPIGLILLALWLAATAMIWQRRSTRNISR